MTRLSYVSRRIVLIGILCTSLECCAMYTDTIQYQTQGIEITSKPSGADVTVVDDNGTRRIGKTPAHLDVGYQVTHRIYDKGSCAVAGAAGVASAFSDDDDDDDDGEDSGVLAILGLIGMVAGAAVGAAACAEADGVVAIQPKTIALVVSLPGYHREKVWLLIPKETPSVHVDLIPIKDDNGKTSSTHVASRKEQPSIGKTTTKEDMRPNVVVFRITSSVDAIEQELLDTLTSTLNGEIDDGETFRTVEQDIVRERMEKFRETTGKACSEITCKTQVARELSAAYGVDSKIVTMKKKCLVAVSLIDTETETIQLSAATRCSCDSEGLKEAMDIIAELLTEPPAKIQ